MWSLRSEDFRLAREYASRRRAEIEKEYHEQLHALDAELAEIDAMQRLVGEFVAKHLRTAAVAPAEPDSVSIESDPDFVEPDPASKNPPVTPAASRSGSRWRSRFGGASAANRGEESTTALGAGAEIQTDDRETAYEGAGKQGSPLGRR